MKITDDNSISAISTILKSTDSTNNLFSSTIPCNLGTDTIQIIDEEGGEKICEYTGNNSEFTINT